eukprot:CAMPEP_0202913222 /NCGR_PEP_ID=MMETSP1392-20130828/59935_1 /ASSEMBLY_ACC=CAM_ASM_000868 /TAXON_ID=225041 /ORGANISM="Chlamydomonas chlamydogama, Strain SAG 11-48b" /LENGTH=82 /DNA_ID=CAMNT_0049604411 /DNA_START=520 /DNA_END=765 /DNA_ORIENTATION=-
MCLVHAMHVLCLIPVAAMVVESVVQRIARRHVLPGICHGAPATQSHRTAIACGRACAAWEILRNVCFTERHVSAWVHGASSV